MACFQVGKITRSLCFRLASRLAFLVLCFGFIAGCFAFAAAMHRSARILDGELLRAAAFQESRDAPLPSAREAQRGKRRIRTFALPAEGGFGLPALGEDAPDGLQTVTRAGESWRVLVSERASGERFATIVSERLRLFYVGKNVAETVLPYLLLMLALMGCIVLIVRSVLKPVQEMARSLDDREKDDVRPLDATALPAEIQPFGEAINRLLGRVAASSSMQRRFVADAAHELRSPLAALLLQAERLAQADLPSEAQSRLTSMRDGLRRAQVLVTQMLAMARVQERQFGAAEEFSVKELVASLFEDVLPQAEAKGVDIGLTAEEDVSMTSPPAAVGLVLKNLLENAVRYAPEQGMVDLRVFREGGRVIFHVADNGPGIPESDRERVFVPFYRCRNAEPSGSGLGLAIVKTVVDQLGGEVSLSAAADVVPRGLLVVVRLPGGCKKDDLSFS